MRHFLTLFISFSALIASAQTPCSGGMAGDYPCNGYDLVAHIPLSTFDTSGANDSWGWTDPQDGKEYVLMGLENGTAFIDISTPTSPVYLGKLPTHSSSTLWRDVKVYQNHAFIVSEAGGHGMQVFDLTRLRNVSNPPVTFTEDAHFNQFGGAHNIVINEASGFAYVVGANTYGGGAHFINIQNPINPIDAGGYSGGGYTHDAQVIIYDGPDPDYQGQEIYFGNNEDRVVIVNVTDKNNPQLISEFLYSNVAYTHQGWLTQDRNYFIIGDEIDESNFGFNTRAIVADVTDLDNPSFHVEYFGPTASIDHNGYVVGDHYYLANYSAGMRVIDISDIANENMTEVGFFDTYPNNNNANYNGVWNVYPFFGSGHININDRSGGFFLVRSSSVDNIDPIAVCSPYTLELDNSGNGSISANDIDGGSSDNSGFFTATISQSTFDCGDLGGPISVTLTITDPSGNSASCTTQVIVLDRTEPEIICLDDMMVNFDPGQEFYTLPDYIASGEVSASDNCDNAPILSQSPAPGTELAVGSYVIEFTASDVSENTSICAFELTVAELGLNALFAQSLSIAPNPASESLVVSNSFAPMTALRLFDVVGKQIRIFEGLDSQSFTIDVTPLTPGIYFLTINEMVTKKIIIH